MTGDGDGFKGCYLFNLYIFIDDNILELIRKSLKYVKEIGKRGKEFTTKDLREGERERVV